MKTHGLRVIQGGGFRQRKKATKIDRLKEETSVLKMANKELIDRLKLLLKTMKEFEKESNWVVKSYDLPEGKEDSIIWIGEGDPPTIIKAVLARIRGAAEKFDEKVELKDGPGTPPAPEEDKDGMLQKPPFVVYGPDSMPAGGMKAPEKED